MSLLEEQRAWPPPDAEGWRGAWPVQTQTWEDILALESLGFIQVSGMRVRLAPGSAYSWDRIDEALEAAKTIVVMRDADQYNDMLGENWGITRLPGESDEALRRRILAYVSPGGD